MSASSQAAPDLFGSLFGPSAALSTSTTLPQNADYGVRHFGITQSLSQADDYGIRHLTVPTLTDVDDYGTRHITTTRLTPADDHDTAIPDRPPAGTIRSSSGGLVRQRNSGELFASGTNGQLPAPHRRSTPTVPAPGHRPATFHPARAPTWPLVPLADNPRISRR